MAWVSDTGEYGASKHIAFDPEKLTKEQWARLEDMFPNDRYDYVRFILDGHNLNVCEIEMENFGEEWGL
jgi:hypothetical protein